MLKKMMMLIIIIIIIIIIMTVITMVMTPPPPTTTTTLATPPSTPTIVALLPQPRGLGGDVGGDFPKHHIGDRQHGPRHGDAHQKQPRPRGQQVRRHREVLLPYQEKRVSGTAGGNERSCFGYTCQAGS
jgi:hypothetical protein